MKKIIFISVTLIQIAVHSQNISTAEEVVKNE